MVSMTTILLILIITLTTYGVESESSQVTVKIPEQYASFCEVIVEEGTLGRILEEVYIPLYKNYTRDVDADIKVKIKSCEILEEVKLQ